MENGVASTKEEGFLSRMALNDNKAGMEGLDRDKINKIIMETSKGSKFYENELKRDQQVNQRITKMMLQKARITEQQLKKAQAQVEKVATALEKSRDLSRVIVHVDMDAFYAAVEMRDCPELKDKPMAVGSMSMLSTSNYHARKYGVRAAMPGFIAKKLCPSLVIVPLNFDKYRAVSNEIREIFADYDPNFQPLSLDEAYLDFTDHLEQRQHWPESARTHHFRVRDMTTAELSQEAMTEIRELSPVLFEDSPGSSPSPVGPEGVRAPAGDFEVFGTSVEEAVREMRFRIEQKTMLTASAGIAPNMMLAKVCSDKNKPNGQYRLPSTREAVMDFIHNLPVRKVCGIGKVSEKMLNALGISTCSHLGQQMALLSLLFSETAWHHFLEVSLGLGSTYIPRHEERKSMSTERTFKELSKVEEQLSLCRELCEDLAEDMKKEGLKGKTVTLKLKNVNFEVKTRAMTLPCAVATVDEIFAVAKDLLKTEIENESPQPLRLRLMGVRISAFASLDDKKPLQKSIIGFLQSANAASKNEGSGENAPVIAKAGSPAKASENNHLPPDLSETPSPVQAHASTSACAESETLTCPVCFRKVETTDLNVFNTHIDQCLSNASQKTNNGTESDTESESDLKKDREERAAVNKLRRRHEAQEKKSKVNPQKGQSSVKKDSVQKVSLIKDDNKTATSQEPQPSNSKGPVFVCPVCQLTQETHDLAVFNHHVDLCLNQEVLHELGRQTSSSINLSPRTSLCVYSEKFVKSLGPCNTIDKFFR
uniref:DNA polymerase kappa n=1 Tax=Oreochromis niloticus TaxID=8128 RepID=A0A669D479_ORENI